MPDLRSPQSNHQIPKDGFSAARCFGLRIESHCLQAAIASPLPDGRFRLEIDEIKCSHSEGWLTVDGAQLLEVALETLVDRNQMRRHRVALSLDGDFCVTRVTIGTKDRVTVELEKLTERVPRYLQLGPGEKVTGYTRTQLDSDIDYAVTGVVNRSLIELIYNSLRAIDIEVAWVEPSLVSVARMVGLAEIGDNQPVMIADGTGKQWDVGIAFSGRLLLDYRPTGAEDEEALCDAIVGHFSRLKRFCNRHCGIETGELTQMLICGSGEKTHRALKIFDGAAGLVPSILQVPQLPHLYEINHSDQTTSSVPAVATVLPLLIGVSARDIPDLLQHVRRAPDLPWIQRAFYRSWSVAAACLILCISYGLVSSERKRHANLGDGREALQAEIVASRVKFAELSHKKGWLNDLKRIESQTIEPSWDQMLQRITQSLPDSVKLNEFRVELTGDIFLDGTTIDETVIYELVNTLRHLPTVTQVALKGTTPDQDEQTTRFLVVLNTNRVVSTNEGDFHHE